MQQKTRLSAPERKFTFQMQIKAFLRKHLKRNMVDGLN